jgi:hypothetical protein
MGRPLAVVANLAALSLAVTAWAMVPMSLRPREFDPRTWQVLCASLSWVVIIPVSQLRPEIMACGSALVAGALFWRTWRAMPASFQAAPLAAEAPSRAARGGPSAFVWWPVVRALIAPAVLLWIPAILIQGDPRQWLVGTVFASFPLGIAISRSYWLLTLPIGRGRLLAVILACCGLPIVAGHYGRLLLPGKGFSSFSILRGGVVILEFLAIANAILIGNHFRMRLQSKVVQGLWIATAGGGVALLSLDGAVFDGGISAAVQPGAC